MANSGRMACKVNCLDVVADQIGAIPRSTRPKATLDHSGSSWVWRPCHDALHTAPSRVGYGLIVRGKRRQTPADNITGNEGL
jgi:hypothetical protein